MTARGAKLFKNHARNHARPAEPFRNPPQNRPAKNRPAKSRPAKSQNHPAKSQSLHYPRLLDKKSLITLSDPINSAVS